MALSPDIAEVPRWAIYHRVYAWCQFAVAAIAVLILAWQCRTTTNRTDAVALAIVAVLTFVGFALYPLVLLGILPRRRYWSQGQQSDWSV